MPIRVVKGLWHKRHQEPISLLKNFVSINSQSKNFYGVNKIQYKFGKILTKLGFKCLYLNNIQASSGKLLFARRKTNILNAPNITLVCHSDTVNTSDKPKKINYHILGNKITAPGVLDDKAGIVTLLEFLTQYLSRYEPTCNLAVVCSPNEEVGSPGFNNLFRSLGHKSDVVLGFEPALGHGHVINQRNGNRWYKITCYGQGGHSGRVIPGKVNPVHELSYKISRLHELNNPSQQISINCSHIECHSTSYNTVSEFATVYIDVRFSHIANREIIHQKITQIIADKNVCCPYNKNQCETNFMIEDDCPPLQTTKLAQDCAELFADNYRKLWRENIESKLSEGASDLNYFATKSNIVLDGFGGVGGNMHCFDEWLEIDSIGKRARALVGFINEMTSYLNSGETNRAIYL